MNEMFTVYLDFEPGNKENEELLNRMDKVIEENGWKYAGVLNMYLPIEKSTRDETIHKVIDAIRNTDWLKPYNPKVLVANAIDVVKMKDIDVSRMTAPSKIKLKRYEDFYKSSKKMAHDIVVDENGKIRDGYISYLLAWKYDVHVKVLSTWKNKPVKKIVIGKHVKWDGEKAIEKGQKHYSWIYDLKEAVIPGDILLVHTEKGLAHMKVDKIDYITGDKTCSKYRKVKRNETAYA